MNIGIVAYRQAPYISANTAIAYTLGEEFIRKGINVVHIGRLQDAEQKQIRDYNGIPICFLNRTPKAEWSRAENYLMRANLYKMALHEDIRSLQAIAQDRKLDGILCVTAPNENALIVSNAELNIPCVLFQLDPFYNNLDVENKRLKYVFQKLLPAFQHSFTTDLLMDTYRKDTEMGGDLARMSVAQFPKLIRQPAAPPRRKGTEAVRLLYAGSLYRPVRDPLILRDLKHCLPPEIELVYCGTCDKDDVKKLSQVGVVCKGYCSQENLAQEVANADILINIGNTVKNQLGSKLIDYIATGKPILNIIQIPDCATINVLEKYDNHLTVMASELDRRLDEIEIFVRSSAGQIIPWEIIRSTYGAYTPSYVAEQILSAFSIKY